MSSSERVDKYAEDAQKLVQEGNAGKIVAEVKRLRTWLQKHQEERLTDGAKGKLLSVVQSYFKAGQGNDSLQEQTKGLVEDLLKLPEGKLVSAKAKKSALKWLGGMDVGDETLEGVTDENDAAERTQRLLLVDVEEGGRSVSVMDEASGDVRDGIAVDEDALRRELQKRFDAGDEVRVLIRGAKLVSVLP